MAALFQACTTQRYGLLRSEQLPNLALGPLARAFPEDSLTRSRPGGFRRALFWIHLSCGVAAGLVIAVLGITGAVLTYERQLVDAVARSNWPAVPEGTERRSLDRLVGAVAGDGFRPETVTVRVEHAAPVEIAAGRRNVRAFDPWTGAEREGGAPGLESFFADVTALHRWFALEGASRETARAVIGAANLVFAFLVLSGFVLWWPPLLRGAQVRLRLWFSPSYPTARARDWSWHHVLGVWCSVPLLAISLTGAVFHYAWANALVYRVVGEEPPRRGGPPGGERAQRVPVDLQRTFETVAAAAGEWNRITLPTQAAANGTIEVIVDRGNGAQAAAQERVVLDARGEIVAAAPRYADDPGRSARVFVRYLHTGEVFGLVGQTVAGIASASAALLVWTGLALAWRRLVRPVLVRRRRR